MENVKFAQTLKTLLEKKKAGLEKAVLDVAADAPKPILPKSLTQKHSKEGSNARPMSIAWGSMSVKAEDIPVSSRLKLSDLDPLEIARQLTLIEFDLFRKIKVVYLLIQAREFVGLSWMKDDKEVRAPNIIKMVRWSNHVIQWLVTEIVSLKDNLKQRCLMMEKIITIGKVITEVIPSI